MPKVVAFAAALIALTITTTAAYAASTRAEYVGQVEPICKTALAPEVKGAVRYFKGIKKLETQTAGRKPTKRERNRFVRLSAKFLGLVSRVETSVTSQLAGVPPAPGDEGTVATWLQKRTDSIAFLNQGIAALRHHQLRAVKRSLNQWNGANEAAKGVVAGFGFRYCVGEF